MSATLIDPEDMTEHQRRAWLDSLVGDDALLVMVPVGYRLTYLIASLVKLALRDKMSAGVKLEFLEGLNGLIDWYFTQDQLAQIEPMCGVGYKVFAEAQSLDREDDINPPSFKVLTSWRVFGYFIQLNPSILAAVKLREQARNLAAAPPVAVTGTPTAAESYARNPAVHEIPDRFLERNNRDH